MGFSRWIAVEVTSTVDISDGNEVQQNKLKYLVLYAVTVYIIIHNDNCYNR